MTEQNQPPVGVTDEVMDRHPAVRDHILRMWNTGKTGTLEQWSDFINSLTAALSSGVRVKPICWDKHPDDQEWYAADIGDWGVAGYVISRNPVGSDWRMHVRGHLVHDGFNSPAEAKAAAQADYERRILSSIEPTPSPSHAETVAPYAAALRMIRDAVGELFGPVSDLESEEAVLLRGPEPHHEAEAIIAGLQRVKERPAPAPAELERYEPGQLGRMDKAPDGQWVTLSDAQAAIAAKDGGWERAWLEQKRAEAAEARVADLEKALERIADYPSSGAGACPDIARAALKERSNEA